MRTAITLAAGILGGSRAVACASPAGVEPGAMSADKHAAVARQDTRTAEALVAEYDPDAVDETERCSSAAGGGISRARNGACWTPLVNPAARQLKEAKRLRRLAAQHRAASQALRAAEAHACVGISEQDRDMSPFAHREDIQSVTRLQDLHGTDGAKVVFASLPEMTAEWLRRVVDCHLARNAAIGFEAASADMPYCPLAVGGARARVESVGDGFAVEINGSDPASVEEIIHHAEMLRAVVAGRHTQSRRRR